LTPSTRAERMQAWETAFACMAEAFATEISIIRQHLRPEEVPPLERIPDRIVEAFVQWPRTLPPVCRHP
jgi:hypothetical protein